MKNLLALRTAEPEAAPGPLARQRSRLRDYLWTMKSSSVEQERETAEENVPRPVSPKSSPAVKKFADVRDGKLFHIRVTVGYLSSLRTTLFKDAVEDDDCMVTAFASFGMREDQRGEYDFASSLLLTPDAPRQTVKWPKGSDVKTSMRRIYQSVMLRVEDSLEEEEKTAASDEESEISGSRSPYAPELLNIFLGVKKGDEEVAIGVATIVMNGKPVKGQVMELPIRKIVVLPRKQPSPISPIKAGKSIKGLFGAGKKNQERQKSPDAIYRGGQGTFHRHGKTYTFDKNAILQVKLDVMEGLYENSGPGLWGDFNDDEESFGPIPVIDIPEDCTGDLSDRYSHESIEVVPFKQGATIVSSPGGGEANEKRQIDSDSPVTIKYDEPAPKNNTTVLTISEVAPFFMCGASQMDDVSEMPMTASITDHQEDSSLHSSEAPTKSRFTISEVGSQISDSEDDSTHADSELEEAEAAANTLVRYANKLGVPVEDLLDGSRDDSSSEGTEEASRLHDSYFEESAYSRRTDGESATTGFWSRLRR